jgi:hypothetical protein
LRYCCVLVGRLLNNVLSSLPYAFFFSTSIMSSLAQRALAAVLIPAQLCLCGVDGPRGGERTNRYGFNLFSSLLLVKRSIDDWGIEETVSSYVKLNKWVLRENIKFRLFFARLE